MIMNAIKKPVYFFLCLIVVFPLITGGIQGVSAQTEPAVISMAFAVPGAVILKTGDTLYGKIRITKYAERNFISQIKFTGKDGEKTKYDAGSIFGFAVGDVYECRPTPKKGTMVFMNRMIKGKITVFQNSNSAGMGIGGHYMTEYGKINGISFTYSHEYGLTIEPHYLKRTVVLKEPKIWYSGYFVEKDGGELIMLDKKNYDSYWDFLFGDCPGIQEEIDKEPKLEKWNSFLLMVMVYNQTCD